MGKKPRAKMPREQRAKQFAPFQAVDGLYGALLRAEEEHRRMLESQSVVNVPAGTEYTEYTESADEERRDYGE